MTLKIIGAGLGRTGTASLREALNSLGYPCYHMFELAFNAERRADVDFWQGLKPGPMAETPDWNRVFAGYRAVLDYPACFFWRQLMAAYPEAKVVLTRHPGGSEAWYDSTAATLYADAHSDKASDFGQRLNRMLDTHVWQGFFGGRFEDRTEAIARYEAHNRAVEEGVPAERLVVFTPDQGWEPICAALDAPVPDRPFPATNSRAEMSRRVGRLERMRAFGLGRRERSDGTSG